MIKKKPFVNYTLDKDKNKKFEIISLKLNARERAALDEIKTIIEQPKDGTAIKTLMEYATKVILEDKTRYLIATLFKNKRNNNRTGRAVEYE